MLEFDIRATAPDNLTALKIPEVIRNGKNYLAADVEFVEIRRRDILYVGPWG